jgi:aryl-alcohol dehydrogenase-like predicted oxidoreductase
MGCARFVTMQNHYNLLYREEEREMIPLCIDQDVGVIPWSPLARGYLARTREALQSTRRLRRVCANALQTRKRPGYRRSQR